MYSVNLYLKENKFLTIENNSDINTSKEVILTQLKILKNSNMFSKTNEVNYNIYQIDLYIDEEDFYNIINNKYILDLSIYYKKSNKRILKTYLYVFNFQAISSNKKTEFINVRIFAYNIIIFQMLNDSGILSSNLSQIQGSKGSIFQTDSSKIITGNNFDEYIQNILSNYYGNNIYAIYIGNNYSKSLTSIDINSIPNISTYKSIKRYLLNYWPYLGVPMFYIDDFFPNPKIVIKFDDLITSNISDAEILITEEDKHVRKLVVPNKTLPTMSMSPINEINLKDLFLESKSNFILSTVNGIKTIQRNNIPRYSLENGQLNFNSKFINPFTKNLDLEFNQVDLDKYILLKENIIQLSGNYKISLSLSRFEDFNNNQILKFDENKIFYIYKIIYTLKRSTETFNYEKLHNININNFNANIDLFVIDVSKLKKFY